MIALLTVVWFIFIIACSIGCLMTGIAFSEFFTPKERRRVYLLWLATIILVVWGILSANSQVYKHVATCQIHIIDNQAVITEPDGTIQNVNKLFKRQFTETDKIKIYKPQPSLLLCLKTNATYELEGELKEMP